MAVIYEIKAKNGSYTNKNGEEKARWLKCGVIFKNDKGHLSMKMEAMPIGGDGWFSLFEPSQDDPSSMPPTASKAMGSKPPAFPSAEDDIPF